MKITEADLYKKGVFRTRGNKDGSERWPVEVISSRSSVSGSPFICLIKKGDHDITVYATENRSVLGIPGYTLDLVRISPYDHIKKYDPVVVWANGYALPIKHLLTFSSSDSSGKAITFTYLGGPKTAWDNCVLLTDYIKEHGEL